MHDAIDRARVDSLARIADIHQGDYERALMALGAAKLVRALSVDGGAIDYKEATQYVNRMARGLSKEEA